MEFKATLEIKTLQGDDAILNFKPVDDTVCKCDSIIVRVPISEPGCFVKKEYTVTITETPTE